MSSPGLSMRLLESKKGLSCFAFEHSEEYQQTQHKFLAAVESMEPNNIVVRESHSRTGSREPCSGLCCWARCSPPVWGPGWGRVKVETPGHRVLNTMLNTVWAGGCRDSPCDAFPEA